MDFPDPSLNTDPNYFHLSENRRWENYEGINKYFFWIPLQSNLKVRRSLLVDILPPEVLIS
jgi:hypothetical protein